MSIKASVIITVFNERDLIIRAIDSILVQSLKNIELLIIDDGSTDGTPDVIKSIDDSRIRLIKSERVGRASSLKLACELASGEYIANLDADDFSYPNRLLLQSQFLDMNNDYAWVGCAEERVDSQRDEHINRLYPTSDADIRKQCVKCIPYSHSGVMFRRSLIIEGINYDSNQPYLIDFEFFLRVASKYKVANLPDVLICRYVRSESYFQSRFKRSKQNRRLSLLTSKAIFSLKLPLFYLVYPLSRLIYDLFPERLKKTIRTLNGLYEKSI